VGLAAAAVTGITSGKLGLALKAGFISAVTAFAFTAVGDLTGNFSGAPKGGHATLDFGSEAHLFNIAGHALVGCASATANRGKCGSGALSGAVGSFAGPLLTGLDLSGKLVATSVLGGLASVAGGGKFANGALTGAFGYLFNEAGNYAQRGYAPTSYTTGPNAGWVCEDICREVGGGTSWGAEILGDTILAAAAAIPAGIYRAGQFLYELVNPSPTQPSWPGSDPSPGSGEGNFYNPNTGESFRPDLDHPDPIGPHWDYRAPDRTWWRIFPDGSIKPK
jgi:hypothetical protein